MMGVVKKWVSCSEWVKVWMSIILCGGPEEPSVSYGTHKIGGGSRRGTDEVTVKSGCVGRRFGS